MMQINHFIFSLSSGHHRPTVVYFFNSLIYNLPQIAKLPVTSECRTVWLVFLPPVSYANVESILKDTLLLYPNHHCLITKDQHGFLKRHSTVTNLLECGNDWTRPTSFNNRACVDILYFYFAKAFKVVSISKLYINSKVLVFKVLYSVASLYF